MNITTQWTTQFFVQLWTRQGRVDERTAHWQFLISPGSKRVRFCETIIKVYKERKLDKPALFLKPQMPKSFLFNKFQAGEQLSMQRNMGGKLTAPHPLCRVCLSIPHFYRPRSGGDNALGSVRLSVRLSVCAFLFEPFDLWPWYLEQTKVITSPKCLSVISGCMRIIKRMRSIGF